MTYQVGDLLLPIHYPDCKPCIVRRVTQVTRSSVRNKVPTRRKVPAYAISSIDDPHYVFIVADDEMCLRFKPLEVKYATVSK